MAYVEEPLPQDDCDRWYHHQYSTQGCGPHDVNAFLRRVHGPHEHLERRSWVLSLPQLVKRFCNTYTAEVIYELYNELPVMVSRKVRQSKASGRS